MPPYLRTASATGTDERDWRFYEVVDQEDSLGMIVVTEELSRGSLGAAGSLITRPEILSRALLKGGTEEQKQHWNNTDPRPASSPLPHWR